MNTDATYMGFIQGICWVTGADGNNPTTFNEPDRLWVDGDDEGDGADEGHYVNWDRNQFLRLFASWDDDSPVMLLKLLDDCSWVVWCTESDDAPSYAEAAAQGFRFAHELWTCSRECLAGEGRGQHADLAVWHHINCPNHTIRCCSGPVDDTDDEADDTDDGAEGI